MNTGQLGFLNLGDGVRLLPYTSVEIFDIDDDGVDEIICFDFTRMWIYKANEFVEGKKFIKYSDDSFSNYRGEFLIPYDYD